MTGVRILEELKRDAFGVVERVRCRAEDGSDVELVRRVVLGPPGVRSFARLLARRERRALEALRAAGSSAALPAPPLDPADAAELTAAPTVSGVRPRPGDVFLRPFAAGTPLHRADELPLDFFALLEAAARSLHAAGVCHNDLHKEQNVVVDPDGRPVLIDFQLASVHPRRRGRAYDSRCRDDLRHVQKLRRRYTKDGRGPAEIAVAEEERMPRTGVALLWKRTVKPVYRFVTRRILGTRDGEEGRPSAGPWPRWVDPVGPRGDAG
ncbi:MAG: phosphotransferase [Planctomycetota bacterium]